MTGTRGSLGDRLLRARRQRFVGRSGEVEIFRSALGAPHESFRVLFMHGPGGVGKSALLDALADVAAAQGATPIRVDARSVSLTAGPHDLGEVLGGSDHAPLAGVERPVLLLDTYELLESADEWVRSAFLPALPGDALVVIAGRKPPAPHWVADPAWRDLLRVVSLRNLAPKESQAFLTAEGIPTAHHEQLLALSHGHPLTLSLLAAEVRRDGGTTEVPGSLADLPDLVRALLAHVVEQAPTPQHRAALEVCAHVRFTTEDLLRALVPADDAAGLFTWLRSQSFTDEGPHGLFPHDVVRDVLDADLRWRDPAGYADLHRRVRRHLVERIRRTAGERDRRRHVGDAMYVARAHPGMRPYFEQPATGGEHIDMLRPVDRDAVLAMTEHHQGRAQRDLADHWLDRQPEAFRVFRDLRGGVRGYAGRLALHDATASDRDHDPGTRAMWDYAQRHGAPRGGEQVMAWRFFLDRDRYHDPSTSLGLVAVWNLEDILSSERCSWDFLGTYEDADRWAPVMGYLDFGRAAEADYRVGDRTYAVFAHDWRRVDVGQWLELTADRELGLPGETSQEPARELVLSQPDFTAAVRAALRELHDGERLARNPLAQSRLVRDRGGAASEALRALLLEAVEALRADPRDHHLADVMNRTFLRPAATQEAAAESLHLSFSTYRRHRDRAVTRVVERLWRREVYGEAEVEHHLDSR